MWSLKKPPEDANGNPIPDANGKIVYADGFSFVDVPAQGRSLDHAPTWFATVYLAWSPAPRTLNIAQYGINWGLYAQ